MCDMCRSDNIYVIIAYVIAILATANFSPKNKLQGPVAQNPD